MKPFATLLALTFSAKYLERVPIDLGPQGQSIGDEVAGNGVLFDSKIASLAHSTS